MMADCMRELLLFEYQFYGLVLVSRLSLQISGLVFFKMNVSYVC